VMAPTERAKQARRAAEGGSLAAQTQLGVFHLHGWEGVEQDNVQAAALFLPAADLGHAQEQMSIAWCYNEGTGVEQNYALAAEWGCKAADQGDATAQWFVGGKYMIGEEVPQDVPLGKTYLELSAAQGFEVGSASGTNATRVESAWNEALETIL
jgi:TPR repeat protein